MSRMTMSCASFSSARPAIRRACSSEVRVSFVLRSSAQSVARVARVSNGHGPADAIATLSDVTTDQKGAISELAIQLYAREEIDAFALYCLELDRCFFVPIAQAGGRQEIRLRLSPTRNNQRRGIRWADDFDFAARLREHQGAVAQLGERMPGRHEVTGSSPVG